MSKTNIGGSFEESHGCEIWKCKREHGEYSKNGLGRSTRTFILERIRIE